MVAALLSLTIAADQSLALAVSSSDDVTSNSAVTMNIYNLIETLEATVSSGVKVDMLGGSRRIDASAVACMRAMKWVDRRVDDMPETLWIRWVYLQGAAPRVTSQTQPQVVRHRAAYAIGA